MHAKKSRKNSLFVQRFINSKDQPLEPETLKEELLNVVNKGWKNSKTDRKAEHNRSPVLGLTRESRPSQAAYTMVRSRVWTKLEILQRSRGED